MINERVKRSVKQKLRGTGLLKCPRLTPTGMFCYQAPYFQNQEVGSTPERVGRAIDPGSR